MSEIERGGDDERDALGAEEVMAEMTQKGTERLLREFSPEQIAEWFLGGLNGQDFFDLVDGAPLDPSTGKPILKEMNDTGF